MNGGRRAFVVMQIGWMMSLGYVHCRDQRVMLQKIYHHRGMDKERSLEAGKVVLYFSAQPIINRLPVVRHKKGDWRECVYFFPTTELSRQGKQMLAQITSLDQERYAVKLEQTMKPVPGIKLFVQYDPRVIMLEPEGSDVGGRAYRTFDSIGLHKGVEFTFYNKNVHDALRKRVETPLLQLASLKKKRSVVIDCGHGGADKGAIGYNGLQEKDVALDVGLRAAQLLRKKGVAVSLTRSDDVLLALDERTRKANREKADLFISIHANAAFKKVVCGIETYCLNNELFTPANVTVLDDRYDKSRLLAQHVQRELISYARSRDKRVIDRSVKHNVAQVLLGVTIPAILVEVGFVSHVEEARLLQDAGYRQMLAQGISTGIYRYFKQEKIEKMVRS